MSLAIAVTWLKKPDLCNDRKKKKFQKIYRKNHERKWNHLSKKNEFKIIIIMKKEIIYKVEQFENKTWIGWKKKVFLFFSSMNKIPNKKNFKINYSYTFSLLLQLLQLVFVLQSFLFVLLLELPVLFWPKVIHPNKASLEVKQQQLLKIDFKQSMKCWVFFFKKRKILGGGGAPLKTAGTSDFFF